MTVQHTFCKLHKASKTTVQKCPLQAIDITWPGPLLQLTVGQLCQNYEYTYISLHHLPKSIYQINHIYIVHQLPDRDQITNTNYVHCAIHELWIVDIFTSCNTGVYIINSNTDYNSLYDRNSTIWSSTEAVLLGLLTAKRCMNTHNGYSPKTVQ